MVCFLVSLMRFIVGVLLIIFVFWLGILLVFFFFFFFSLWILCSNVGMNSDDVDMNYGGVGLKA